LDKNDNFNMYGLYTISSGDFNITLGVSGGVLSRNFKLENGGRISWNGDPTQGIINVRAIQTSRVANPTVNSEESTKSRPISVNNIVSLNGRLLNPDMSFTFTLPDADEMTRAQLYSLFDTTNREEMVRQVLNVLLTGRFETSNNPIGSNTNSMIEHSISELISAKINELVSSISKNLDVRVGYRTGENTTENEYTVDVGGSFLNDRLTVRTNFGILEKQDMETQERFLGDFIVQYQIFPNVPFWVKGFNITNPQDRLEIYTSTYSQGLGLNYVKEFDTVKELFIRKTPKKKKKTTEKQSIEVREEEK